MLSRCLQRLAERSQLLVVFPLSKEETTEKKGAVFLFQEVYVQHYLVNARLVWFSVRPFSP